MNFLRRVFDEYGIPMGESELCDQDILEQRRFARRVELEGERCDRNGAHFSVLTVKLESRSTPWANGELVARVLRSQVRETDTIGKIGEKALAALLPDTDRWGAECLAGRLRFNLGQEREVEQGGVRTSLGIYVYPSPTSRGRVIQMVTVRPKRQPDYRIRTHDRARSAWRVDLNAERTLETGIIVGSIEVYQPLPLGKRAFDIAVSLIGLLVALPLLLLLCSWVWLVDGRPALFRQIRVGHRGRRFPLYKIRTVRSSRDCNPHYNHAVDFISGNKTMTKIDDCLELIPLGKLLRASGLDELPQIFNIIRGEMSLIGPRPCLPYEEERYRPWHRKRFEAHPGVSGLWQVNGKNRLTFDSMVRLDIRYERTRSPLTDFSIIAQTPRVIVEELVRSRTRAFE